MDTMKSTAFMMLAAVVGFLASGYQPMSVEPSEARVISVSGEAVVKVEPDEVILTLGVETFHNELGVAKKRNDQKVEQVIRIARNYGIESKYIQTDHISIEPRYEDDYWRDTIKGYYVRQTVVLTLRDLAKFDALLSEMVEEGANYVHGIDFRTTELRKYRDQARALAIQAAQEKASDMARALGLSIGEPLSIHEDQAGWWSWYGAGWWGARYQTVSQNVVQNTGGSSLDFEGTIAPGQISVNARVSVSFELEP